MRIETIKTALDFLHSHYQEKLYIRDLALQVNMNEQYFCRFFKKVLGKSPITYLNEYRIKQACILLQTTDLPIMEVGMDCGFFHLGNFMKEFKNIQRLRLYSTAKSHNNAVLIKYSQDIFKFVHYNRVYI